MRLNPNVTALTATSRPLDQGWRQVIRQRAYLLFGLLGVMWLVQMVNWLAVRVDYDADLNQKYGILPQSIEGLSGVLCAPFLHDISSLNHLLGNSLAFAFLGGLILISGRRSFLLTFVVSALVAGLGTWAFAAPGVIHIGASGVVFGFLGFLIFRAWFHRRVGWILVAVIALAVYGFLLGLLVKQQQGLSWHGHFFGFLGGLVSAKLAPLVDKDAYDQENRFIPGMAEPTMAPEEGTLGATPRPSWRFWGKSGPSEVGKQDDLTKERSSA